METERYWVSENFERHSRDGRGTGDASENFELYSRDGSQVRSRMMGSNIRCMGGGDLLVAISVRIGRGGATGEEGHLGNRGPAGCGRHRARSGVSAGDGSHR